MVKSSVFAFLLLISLSFSAVSDYSMDITVDDYGTASVISEIDFVDSADKQVSFCFSGNFFDAKVYDRSGLLLASNFDFEGNFTCIYFTVPEDYVKMYFDSYEFTLKDGSVWAFDMRIYSSEDIDSFYSSVLLPRSSVLTKTNGAVESSGDSLLVSWNAENITASKKIYITAGYRIVPNEDFGGIFLFVIFIAVVIVSYLSYRKKYMPESKPEPETPKSKKPKAEEWLESNEVFKTLDEVDKEIVREIAKQKGRTTQAKIYLNTHIAKATLSRRLNSLENREIIEKSQKGNRNLISLKLKKK